MLVRVGQRSDAQRLSQSWVERIQYADVELREIPYVAGDDRQVVNRGGRCDHRVLDQLVRLSMHEARPCAECLGVHIQDVVGLRDLLQPCFKFGRSSLVPLTRDLNACLNFADGNG